MTGVQTCALPILHLHDFHIQLDSASVLRDILQYAVNENFLEIVIWLLDERRKFFGCQDKRIITITKPPFLDCIVIRKHLGMIRLIFEKFPYFGSIIN